MIENLNNNQKIALFLFILGKLFGLSAFPLALIGFKFLPWIFILTNIMFLFLSIYVGTRKSEQWEFTKNLNQMTS